MTDRRRPALLALLCSTATAWVAGHQSGWVGAGWLILLVATLAIAWRWGALAGAAAGIAAAWAGLELLRRLGEWDAAMLPTALALVAGLQASAWSTARLASSLARRDDVPAVTLPTVDDSLGLLTAEAGRVRLAEEVERAALTASPLTIAAVHIEVVADDLPEAARRGAERAVLRLLDSRLRPIDVPFAVSDSTVVAILPGTSGSDSTRVMGHVLAGLDEATYAVRETGERRAVRQDVRVAMHQATLSPETPDAEALLAACLPTGAG